MAERPNIVFFYWDNFGWGELGCYGGGVLRGAPTPRIDGLAAEGRRLLNFNVEAQCTPSRGHVLAGEAEQLEPLARVALEVFAELRRRGRARPRPRPPRGRAAPTSGSRSGTPAAR